MHKMMRNVKRLVPAILLVCFASPALAVKPVTNVTAATGGNAISNSNIASGTWVTLTGPSIEETANNGISDGTLVLNAPTGFQFNAASAVTATVSRVSGTKKDDLTLSSGTATVTATTITITVTSGSTGQILNRITWSGIQVMPTGCLFPATNPGDITITGTSISNGTNLDTNIAGTLTEIGSTGLTFVQQPTNAFVNATIAPAVTINACGNGTVLPTVTVALTTPAGATLGGTLSVATNNLTGLATFSDLSVDLANTYTLTTTSPGLTSTESNSFTILNPNPGGFNAFESITAPGAITGNIFTKLAGTAFSLDVIALNLAKNAVMTTFTGDVKVELLDASNNTGALDANNCRNTWAVIQTLAPNVTFAAGDNGRKAGVSFTENSARKEARIRVTYPAAGAPTAIGCSTDVFSIRPAAFSSIISNMSADATGSSTSAAPILNAGGNFTLTATAIPGYDGTPLIDSTKLQAHAGAIATGSVAGAFPAADVATGVSTSAAFTYSEVGYFRSDINGIYDAIYTSIDQMNDCTNDFSNTLVGGKYGCKFGNTVATDYFGRFVPDHYSITFAPATARLVNRSDIPACEIATTGDIVAATTALTVASSAGFAVGDQLIIAGAGVGGEDMVSAIMAIAGTAVTLGTAASASVTGAVVQKAGFSYMDETMVLGFSIEARNAADVITQNYSGALAKLDLATLVSFGFAGADGTNYFLPTDRLSLVSSAGVWTNGTADVSVTLGLSSLPNAITPRTGAADGPYNNLYFGVNASDADGVGMLAAEYDLNTDATAGFDHVKINSAPAQLRFGRLKLSNAHGSELLNLPVPLLAQYWNGTGFVTNTADNCTQVLVPSVANTDLTKNPAGLGTNATMNGVAAPGLGIFVSGDGKLNFSKPNAKGYVDITIADTPVYLKYDWDTSTPGLESPSSRATFGVYKGSDEFIYMRENY